MTQPRAVLYLRLSAVVDDSTSIVRQEADLRAEAQRRGWRIVDVLVDAATSGRKTRAKAEQAVQAIADGSADVLAVWKLDRFTRQGWDGLGALSRALDQRPEALFLALQDGLSSDQSAFRLIAGVLSEVARSEADNAAARIKSSIAHRKTVAGKYAGGSAVPFGYRSAPAEDGVGRVLVIDPGEADIVREVARRLLDGGESLTAIARDVAQRGIPTSKSPARRAIRSGADPEGLDRGIWRPSTVRNIWTSDHLAGRVAHHGDFIKDADGLPATVWPPVIDLSTLDALRRRMNWQPRPGSPASKYFIPATERQPQRRRAARLLSGLAYCAHCDGKMYVTTSSGKPVYACKSSRNGIECPSPKVDALALEQFVTAEFLAAVGSANEVETTEETTGADVSAQLAEVDALIRETANRMTDDDADVTALSARLGTLKATRATLKATPVTTRTISRPTGRTLAQAWAGAELDIDTQRRLLLGAVDHVAVSPANRGARVAGRARVMWSS